EAIADRPVITRAHAVFSGFVVLATLGTGLASGASLPLAAPFAAVAAVSLAAAAPMLSNLPGRTVAAAREPRGPNPVVGRIVPLLLVGALGALAFAGENAHQSWSALFAREELHSGTGLASIAPALFAATVAITRFAAGGLGAAHARTVLLAGA